jgi:diguanylate cyclase (GGDEF)-like protein
VSFTRRLTDRLLGTEPLQRVRLAQAGLAILLMSAGVAAMHWFVWIGVAPARPVAWWTAVSLAGMAAAWVAIRSGWSRRFADPALTSAQMVYAIGCGAWAYALVGPGRGGVFPILMVILMFGMFQLRPGEVRRISLLAVALFGAVMALMAWRRPEVYVPAVEFGHFIMVATMLPAVSLLAGRLSRLRERHREQKNRLAAALERIQELATRDELTGLINRRQLEALLEQEHRRSARAGQSFCVALLDIDGLRALNAAHGRTAGDDVLRTLARECQAAVRLSDMLGRWSGGTFLLLLTDTRAALARSGLERLRERAAASRLPVPGGQDLRVTLSAGLAEHIAGESMAETLQRAARALQEAKAEGRDRLVVA